MDQRRGGTSTATRGWASRRPPARAQRTPPARRPPPKRRGTIARRVRTGLVVASTLVLLLTGTAWGLYRDVTAGITTTDVITGGSSDGAQNILLVGVDSRTDAQGNPLPPEVLEKLHSGADTGILNSDTIMVLHVPDGGGAASAFSIPRDSYVDIPGYRRDKINAAYPAVKALTAERLVNRGVRDHRQVETDAGQAGRTALIGAVEGLTGLTIDHYAEINLLGFYNLTAAIGGVDVCLKAPVDDVLSGARFPAGPQTISGGDALAFVRQRHGLPDGDLSRIRRQQVFLAAVADKVLSAGTMTDPAKLGGLVDVLQKSLVIDSGWDLLAFAQQASDIAAGNLEFRTIPTRGLETNTRGDVVVVDRFEVKGFVERVIDAQAAEAEKAAADKAAQEAAAAAPTTAPLPAGVVPSRYLVDVRNGSTKNGLAAAVSSYLRGVGFPRGTIDTTVATDVSVVRYTGSDGDAAEATAQKLGGIPTEQASDVPKGHLVVVIGADFNTAVVPTSAPPTTATTTSAPPPAPTDPITAAGVPCID
ncbi:LCP family protein [Pseudonocardia sp. TRM90224]|uniref:LCP family protein n=1 Tax=Pseudonocardia sp. TRM90224 TaxID=2812678 RepID=UPI001E28986F|nr:LCP family protein [Pseudonocardia sp. TRM90224]